MTSQRSILLAGLLFLWPSARSQAEETPVSIPQTHHILVPLMEWERGSWNAQFTAWFDAMKAAGYTVDYVADDKLPDLSAQDLLKQYDAVAFTTRTTLKPRFVAELEEFVRQGGGLILVPTAGQEAWVSNPINLFLPTTFYQNGRAYGWNTGYSQHEVHALPESESALTAGIDWKSAPPLAWMASTPPPDDELFRGSLGVLEPRQGLIKPLLNTDWKVILRADDAEHSPLAVTGSYGRGRILIWGGAFGGDPNNSSVAAPFSAWTGFAQAWSKFVNWTAGAGKVDAPQPAVWVVGNLLDNPTGQVWSGQNWSFWRNISYALPDSGLSRASGATDAAAALVVQPDPGQAATLGQLAAMGKPLMVCDPATWTGSLTPISPLSTATATPPTLPDLVLGTPVKEPPAVVPPPVPTPAPPSPLKDAALQTPQTWSVRATGSEVFGRDLEQKWFSPHYDSSAWPKQALQPMTQDIGGKAIGYDGAIWYRATINLPAKMPANAIWTLVGPNTPVGEILSAWVDGAPVPLDSLTQSGKWSWALRLKRIKPGVHLLALRLYKSAEADYWTGSRNLYGNTGLTAATAGVLAPAIPPHTDLNPTSPAFLTPAPLSALPPNTPLLFSSRADGDKDFHIEFKLTADQAALSPLLIFNEPGLIRQVHINGQAVRCVNQGSWDGVSDGNTSAFLLQGVLHPGHNTLDFHPDFSRLRNLDYPVAAEIPTRCALPRLEWTGELQTLQAVDPALAPQVPDRLFKPGTVYAAAPDTQVVLRWNDGRPALVRRGSVMSWTSNIVPQLNAAAIHHWQSPWEASGPWEFSAISNGQTAGVARADSLLWENVAPLVCSALAQALVPGTPQLEAVRSVASQRAVEVEISNPGASKTILLAYRILNSLGSMVANASQSLSLAANGTTKTILPLPISGFAGETVKPEWEIITALRSPDNLTGYSYLEKVVEVSPAVRVSISTDTARERFDAGALPDTLDGSPGYRGRQLWWPFLNEDPGSTVYLDGETAHVRVAIHNPSDAAVTTPVTIDVRAQVRGDVVKHLQQTLTLPPHDRQTLELDAQLTGQFEPYLVTVKTGDDAQEKSTVLYSVRPWKNNFCFDHTPSASGLSFETVVPFNCLDQPDNIEPYAPGEIYLFNGVAEKKDLDWLHATYTNGTGNGGGIEGIADITAGLSWGPFDFGQQSNGPDQMSVFPNGEPMMHYIADGISRHHFPVPAHYEQEDFWGNFTTPFNWSTLAAFREWLAVNHPERLQDFAPKTLQEAQEAVRTKLAAEWNAWQNAEVIGSWSAVRDAAGVGSLFWNQADEAWPLVTGWPSAATGTTDGVPIASFLGSLFSAGDTDPATSRMGFGYRFRSYLETTAAALVPAMHFNITSLRHEDMVNEQRMGNMGNATAETYRAYAYDTVWATTVKPDGTLRAVVDTPVSEVLTFPNPSFSGLKYGNRLYDQIYRLASVVEPQQALGVLWVAPRVERMPASVDPRSLYETLRDYGAPLSATISPQYLATAPKTDASGVVYLLPTKLEPGELDALKHLAAQNLPVICLVTKETQATAAQLPSGMTIISLPSQLSPDAVRNIVASINHVTGHPLTASDGTCVYGFGARGRIFVIAQNMWPTAREVEVDVDTRMTGMSGAIRAINLNDNSELPVDSTGDRTQVKVRLGPWDAALVLLAPATEPDVSAK